MNIFNEFLEGAGASEDTPDSLFAQCLDSPWGDKFENFQFNVDADDLKTLISGTEQLVNSGVSLEDQQSNMRRVAAVCIALIKNSPYPDIRLEAVREILLLASVPGSKGNGISTPNALEHVTEVLSRIATGEINDKAKSAEDHFDDDEDRREPSPTADISVLLSVCRDVMKFSSLFLSSGSPELLDGFVDTLVVLLYLGSVKQDYSTLKTIATDALVVTAGTNATELISIMRCLLPILSLRCDDAKLPDNSKFRLHCHKSAVKVVEILVSDIHTLNEKLTVSVQSEPRILDESDSSMASIIQSPSASVSTPATPISEDRTPEADVSILPPKRSLPTGFAAIIGVLQRVLLSCPDKAPVRAQVASSICAIMKAMVSPVLHKKHFDESPVESNIARLKDAVDCFLTFTATIMKSNKVVRRSFAVEVAAQVVRLPNVWFVSTGSLVLSQTAGDQGTFAAKALLLGLFGRCRDVAATVRTRALTAVAAMLDDLGSVFGDSDVSVQFEGGTDSATHFDGFPVELCQGLYNLIVEDSYATASAGTHSFVDTLKLLANDEKPMTRVKALRAYGTALSIRWPKLDSSFHNQPLSELDTISMLVSDDDINMLSKGCSDASVSVRKQAIDSITSLLVSRPVDAYLQDTWVNCVLPLMVDPEGTVQQKVATSVYRVIMETSMEWVRFEKPNYAGSMGQALRSLGWILCSKIVQSGFYKMLKCSVGELLKSEHISVAKNSSSFGVFISVHELIRSLEFACTINLEKSTEGIVNNHDDQDVVSHGAWVILEALIENEKTLNSGGLSNSIDLNSLYNSDFVVKCWESRMASGSNSTIGNCTDDVRILRVLERTVSRNKGLCTSSRFKAICKHIEKNISEMKCNSNAVSAALAVLLAPMTCFKDVDATKQSTTGVSTLVAMGLNDPAFSDWFDATLQTIGRILDIAYSTLCEAIVGPQSLRQKDGLFGGLPVAIPKSTSSRRSSWSDEHFGDSEIPVSIVNAAVFVVGEISMLGFSKDEEDVFATVRGSKGEKKPSYSISNLSNGAYKILIPEILMKLVHMLMPEFLPVMRDQFTNWSQDITAESGTADSLERVPVHTSVRANAFISMGKLCVRDKARATKFVNIFLRELQVHNSGSSTSVRSNALLILGDLCVRFTNLVDRHIGILASCLQDSNVGIRKNAFVLLVQLLVQDFLKWRGMLLYRFLAIVVDPDEEMAEFGKIALKKALDGKFSGIFKQHFVEAVVILNDCRTHPAFVVNETSGGNDGGGECLVDLRGVDLSGPRNRSRRMRVYEFVMDGMTEEDKIQATAKLVQDILGYSVDNSEAIRSKTSPSELQVGNALTLMEEVISDTFKILRSPMLKVGGNKKVLSADEDIDAMDGERPENLAQQAMQNAKIKVLKKLSVQHMIEHVLPVVSSLKHSLERCRSQLQKSLMEYLIEIVRSHKTEVEHALAQDPCLKAEIEYDMKIFERGKEAEAQRNRLEAAELAAESVLSLSSARKSLGSRSSVGSTEHSRHGKRRKSFGGRSASKSPMLKKTPEDGSHKKGDPDFSIALNEASDITPLASKRWSISLLNFSDDQNVPTTNSQEPISGIPRSSLLSPMKEKSASAVAKTQSGGRSDGTSPVKKKSRATAAPQPSTFVEEPLKSHRSGRGVNASCDSLLNISNKM